MKPRRLNLLLLWLLPVVLLSGCWQDAQPEESPELEGIVSSAEPETTDLLPKVFTLPYNPNATLDPITCPDGAQQTLAALLYEGLFELDETLEPQKKLCASYQHDEAMTTWTFRLRGGVSFSDGSALTPSDVAASLERARTSARYAARLSAVQTVSAQGDGVSVILSRPNAHLPALLDIPVVKAGTESTLTPLGTGPYRLASEEDGTVYLAANGGWWGGPVQPTEKVALSLYSNADAVRYQFTSHTVQLMTSDLTGAAPMSATGEFQFQDVHTTVMQFIGFNSSSSLFSNAALRSALSQGIDRDTVVSAYLSGHARSAQFPISPVHPDYPAQLEEPYSYSAFEQAMAAAGYHTGTVRKAVLLVNSENSFKVSIARYLAEALSAFDLEITVRELPWEEFTAELAAGRFDLYYGEVKLSADWDLTSLLGSGGALNYGRFSDPTLDRLLSEYAGGADASALYDHFKTASPLIPVCFKCTSVLSQADVVEQLTPTADNPFYRLSECSIRLAE